jgi:DNA-binding NtrC family response regulator
MFRKRRTVKAKTIAMRNVLFVDDDEIVLQSLKRGLLDESYNKLFAKNPQEALELIQQEEIHVIVADMCMPEMTGLELLRTGRKERPELIGIILTGYEQDVELLNAVEQGEIFMVCSKPWKFGEIDFESIIRRAIDNYNLQSEG